ncbi:hypothetical protein VTJ83DRAFT_3272 [Remersonia thermophila]|uniref:AB hydrolase-1 domain-containing protein n=1 Tax=Remersonia thermophila TaxID=72144 RepID=A0ABR4DDK5_9PEZI
MAPPLPPLPSIAETLKHPAFNTAVWQLVPDRSGITPVAQARGGPIKISWEIHGSGPRRLVLIMGLGGMKSAWQRQTLYFGHQRGDEYSVLIFDNRGMGQSDKPLMRYSTSEMARDVAELLAHPDVGWLPGFPLPSDPPSSVPRSLHVVGISMGGMIAQELACLVPAAIASLGLICTAAAVENTTTFSEHMAQRLSLLLPKTPERSIADAARRMFSRAWLASPTDDIELPDPETTPKVLPPKGGGAKYLKFSSNAERFVAQEMNKRLDPDSGFTVKGFLLQLIAAGWHRKTAEQLARMADEVGRERILVMHGTEDGMISVPHGRKLIEMIRPGKGLIIEGMGHVPAVELRDFHRVLEDLFATGERLNGSAMMSGGS